MMWSTFQGFWPKMSHNNAFKHRQVAAYVVYSWNLFHILTQKKQCVHLLLLNPLIVYQTLLMLKTIGVQNNMEYQTSS